MSSKKPSNSITFKVPKVETYQGKYRIRFTHEKKAYNLYTGLDAVEDNYHINAD